MGTRWQPADGFASFVAAPPTERCRSLLAMLYAMCGHSFPITVSTIRPSSSSTITAIYVDGSPLLLLPLSSSRGHTNAFLVNLVRNEHYDYVMTVQEHHGDAFNDSPYVRLRIPRGQCSNERVVSPRCACIVSTQSLVSGSASESQQQQQQHNQSVGVDSVDLYTNLVTTAAERCSPTCSSSSRASSAHAPRSTMVLSQHLPVAAKPTYYGGSANQKTFAGNYKNVQTVISKPPPARYHSSSAYNMMSYNNGQPCVDNSSVKPLRNIYPMEAKNGMRGK
ncbi:unnamed protein product [Toxocara canis]|uniref:OTU domain-containing protein n=1 Tax=Toxocara canis TaxID=6265 RepID=A0A183UKD8_TOXCA|nr:unnamed protein product [Toxocara canis]